MRDWHGRYLIFGSGLLARELRRVLLSIDSDALVVMASRSASGSHCHTVDITDPRTLGVANGWWSAVFNTAAYTDVDGAEEDATTAMKVNAIGAENIAHKLRQVVRFVHFSTDAVFHVDDRLPSEIDTPNPRSVYGESKLLGEELVHRACPDAIIIRLANLYGQGGKSWASRLRGALVGTEVVVADNERMVAPTWARWAAEIAVLLSQGPPGRLYHACPEMTGDPLVGPSTWARFAQSMADKLNVDASQTVQIPGHGPEKASRISKRPMSWRAPRGRVGALRSLLLPACGIVVPTCDDLLSRYLADAT